MGIKNSKNSPCSRFGCRAVFLCGFIGRFGFTGFVRVGLAVLVDELLERLFHQQEVQQEREAEINCKKPLFFVGDGAALCYNKYSNVPGVLCVPPALRGGRAAAVALVAKQMAERGEAVLPEALLPDYHRLSQAERERAERLAAEAAAQNHQTENGKE